MVKKSVRANSRINATALTDSGADQAKLLYQNLGFVPTKPRLNPAQAGAAQGEHDQHLTIGADSDLIQAPTFDCPTIGGGYPEPSSGFKGKRSINRVLPAFKYPKASALKTFTLGAALRMKTWHPL